MGCCKHVQRGAMCGDVESARIRQRVQQSELLGRPAEPSWWLSGVEIGLL
jgi:hypothetical protein